MEDIMKDVVDWADRPLWVRVALFGIRRRKVAMGWMYGSFVFPIVLVAAWIVWGFPVWGFSVLGAGVVVGGFLSFVLAGFWYVLAIQWTDEHEGWRHSPVAESGNGAIADPGRTLRPPQRMDAFNPALGSIYERPPVPLINLGPMDCA
jgi:hypothetical protein